MSNQFSYELDERQIRIMLRDGETPHDPAAWNRFEQLAEPEPKARQTSFKPKFNLSISRSVLIPVVFILLIGGLSATLFSFVDFKKKDVANTKHILKPEVKPATPASVAIQATVAGEPQHETSPTATQQTLMTTPPPEHATVTATESRSTPLPKVTQSVAPAIASNTPAAGQASQETSEHLQTAQTTTASAKKKRQKKVVSEEIPTINTSSTILNQTVEEPELDLR